MPTTRGWVVLIALAIVLGLSTAHLNWTADGFSKDPITAKDR
jgi:hypothetical protein